LTRDIDEQIIAYIDGQLEPPARADFEMHLAASAALRERMALHRWLTNQIKAACPAPPVEPERDLRLASRLGLLQTGAAGASDAGSYARRSARPMMFAALAATVLVGLFVDLDQNASDQTLIAVEQGRRVAIGPLEESLSSQPSGKPGDVRITLSYRSKEAICRVFSARDGVSGLGCREGGKWIIKNVRASDSNEGNGSELRLAAGDVDPDVMAQVDREIEGEPMNLEEESNLIAAGWR